MCLRQYLDRLSAINQHCTTYHDPFRFVFVFRNRHYGTYLAMKSHAESHRCLVMGPKLTWCTVHCHLSTVQLKTRNWCAVAKMSLEVGTNPQADVLSTHHTYFYYSLLIVRSLSVCLYSGLPAKSCFIANTTDRWSVLQLGFIILGKIVRTNEIYRWPVLPFALFRWLTLTANLHFLYVFLKNVLPKQDCFYNFLSDRRSTCSSVVYRTKFIFGKSGSKFWFKSVKNLDKS
jgi:hypothetical protein